MTQRQTESREKQPRDSDWRIGPPIEPECENAGAQRPATASASNVRAIVSFVGPSGYDRGVNSRWSWPTTGLASAAEASEAGVCIRTNPNHASAGACVRAASAASRHWRFRSAANPDPSARNTPVSLMSEAQAMGAHPDFPFAVISAKAATAAQSEQSSSTRSTEIISEEIGFCRPVSPLCLLLLVDGVAERRSLLAAAPLATTASLALPFGSDGLRILRGFLGTV